MKKEHQEHSNENTSICPLGWWLFSIYHAAFLPVLVRLKSNEF